MPKFARVGRVGIGNPNGPGFRAIRFNEKPVGRIPLNRGASYKGKMFAVARPDAVGLRIDRRRDELYVLRIRAIDPDKTVIAARRGKEQVAAIGRPAERFILAAGHKLDGLVFGVGAGKPDLIALRVGDAPLRGNLQRIAGVDLSWRSALRCYE